MSPPFLHTVIFGKPLQRKGSPAQGQQQNYRSEQDKRATIMMIAARLL